MHFRAPILVYFVFLAFFQAIFPAEDTATRSNSSSHAILRNVRGCGYDRDIVSEEVYIFESDQEARKYIRKIASSSGLADNFEIHAADVDNAAALIMGEKRYILYNQTFMENVRNAAKTNWAGVAILAHEIGHHLNGHDLDGKGSRPSKEIEADIYTGFALAQMGATLEQAQSAMKVFGDPDVVTTHPKKAQRLAAIANGWKRAREMMNKQTLKPSENQDNRDTDSPQKRQKKKKTVRHDIKPLAEFSQIRPTWNQEVEGQNGFHISFNLDLQNVRTKRGRLIMLFHTLDGRFLLDKNGLYTTSEGHVTTWFDVNLPRPGGRFENLLFKFPIDELHLVPKGNHDLYFEIFYGEILDDGSVKWIAQSSKTTFSVKFDDN